MMLKTLSRREVVAGIAVGVPLAAVLADPLLARAAAQTLETVTITTQGGRRVTGALAVPAKTPAAAVLLIHEWWGLNDQIKSVAAELAGVGYLALALDLYQGRVATTRKDARSYMKSVDAATGTDTVTAWAGWLKEHSRGPRGRPPHIVAGGTPPVSPRGTGRLGTIGWCFGGGWSLNVSIAHPADATVVYYGRVERPAADLRSLKGPVLGHFATGDKWINRDMVGRFEAAMKTAGKTYTSHWYEAEHAFANPTGARYDAADAKLAWKRTLAFFKANL